MHSLHAIDEKTLTFGPGVVRCDVQRLSLPTACVHLPVVASAQTFMLSTETLDCHIFVHRYPSPTGEYAHGTPLLRNLSPRTDVCRRARPGFVSDANHAPHIGPGTHRLVPEEVELVHTGNEGDDGFKISLSGQLEHRWGAGRQMGLGLGGVGGGAGLSGCARLVFLCALAPVLVHAARG